MWISNRHNLKSSGKSSHMHVALKWEHKLNFAFCDIRLVFSDRITYTKTASHKCDIHHQFCVSSFWCYSGSSEICAISDCQFSYTVRTHRYMEKIMHLVPENYLVDGKHVVPGVAVVDPKDGKQSSKWCLVSFHCVFIVFLLILLFQYEFV